MFVSVGASMGVGDVTGSWRGLVDGSAMLEAADGVVMTQWSAAPLTRDAERARPFKQRSDKPQKYFFFKEVPPMCCS